MVIEFNDKNLYQAALKAADEYEYHEALIIFAGIDSYESYLNQIGCLCCLSEVFYAADLYRIFKSRYFSTHNCYYDVKNLGDVTKNMLLFAETRKLSSAEIQGDNTKLYADKTLLATTYFRDSDERQTQPDFDYFGDLSSNFELIDYSNLNEFSIGTDAYYDYLRFSLEKAFLEGDEKTAARLSGKLLEVDTNHVPTIEAQISLCLFDEKYSKGVKYALKLADSEDCTTPGVCGAVEILLRAYKPKYNEALRKLLNKALIMSDEVQVYDLDDFVAVCLNKLIDVDMAYSFATLLYSSYRRGSIESLKKCAVAFHNYGDKTQAREAICELSRYAPYDFYATALLDFFNNSSIDAKLTVSDRMFSHYSLPKTVARYLQCRFAEKFEKNDLTLDENDLNRLSALLSYCKTLLLEDKMDAFAQTGALVKSVLHTFTPQDNAQYIQFAKKELSLLMTDGCMSEAILALLIRAGCRDEIMVSMQDKYYYLDLSTLKIADEVFVNAFAICATMRAVDVDKLQKAYAALVEAVGVISEFDIGTSRQVAFCMLAITYPTFTESGIRDNFAESEDALYKKYLDTVAN